MRHSLLAAAALVGSAALGWIGGAHADAIEFGTGSDEFAGSPVTYIGGGLQVSAAGFLYNPPTVNYLETGMRDVAQAGANGIGVAGYVCCSTLASPFDGSGFSASALVLDLGSASSEARTTPLTVVLDALTAGSYFAIYESSEGSNPPVKGANLANLSPIVAGSVDGLPLPLGIVSDEYVYIESYFYDALRSQDFYTAVLSSISTAPAAVPEPSGAVLFAVVLIGLGGAQGRRRLAGIW